MPARHLLSRRINGSAPKAGGRRSEGWKGGGRGRINIFIGHSNKRKETKACGEADGSV